MNQKHFSQDIYEQILKKLIVHRILVSIEKAIPPGKGRFEKFSRKINKNDKWFSEARNELFNFGVIESIS